MLSILTILSKMSNSTTRLTLSHATLAVRDLNAMVDFYTSVLGFVVSDRGAPLPGAGEMAFITQDPSEHHQLVLVEVPAPPPRSFMLADHLAFRTGTLDDLRALASRLADAQIADVVPISHGNAWSLYFTDPEGNGVECFVDSPFHVGQPYADSLDLSMSDAEVESSTRGKVEGRPEFQSADSWRDAMAARLGHAPS